MAGVKCALLCNGDTAARYKFQDISLEKGNIFDANYASLLRDMYTQVRIPYSKVMSI